MLIEHLIPEKALTVMAAPSYTGKTHIAIEIGLSLATGSNFLDHFKGPTKPVPVIYHVPELHASLFRNFYFALHSLRYCHNSSCDMFSRMIHLPAGSTGIVGGPLIVVVLGMGLYFTKQHEAYNLEPRNVPNAFEPFLVKYIRLAEFIVGLATGSIVLLVGSSALHSQTGRLPWIYATPLIFLAWCVLFGVVFMAWLILNYEGHRHGDPHTRLAYTISETLGFSSLLCFACGYFWLIFAVTR
jgi:hypothetical protein